MSLVVVEAADLERLVRAAVRAELGGSGGDQPSEVMNLHQVATLLGRSAKHVIEVLVEERKLPCHYISARDPRFLRTEVLTWLAQQPARKAG